MDAVLKMAHMLPSTITVTGMATSATATTAVVHAHAIAAMHAIVVPTITTMATMIRRILHSQCQQPLHNESPHDSRR